MHLEEIDLDSLEINSSNDRHGDLENSDNALRWLFENKELHMRNLANDILKQGKIYEPPLVKKLGSKFIIYDGNRRVACLKSICNPKFPYNKDLENYFLNLKNSWQGELPNRILCQVEKDIGIIDEILYRRHTGVENGVGQSRWDGEMKDNFRQRTNKSKAKPVEDIVTELLDKEGYRFKNKLPRSTARRLLTRKNSNRIGFEIVEGKIIFHKTKEEVVETLARVAHDLSDVDGIRLPDIWSSKEQKEYLDRLENEGLIRGITSKPEPISKSESISKSPLRPNKRRNLIPQNSPNISPEIVDQRIYNIWYELRYALNFDNHLNAISVMFRVLLELSISRQAKLLGITFGEKEKFHAKTYKVAQALEANKKIELGCLKKIERLSDGSKFISISTFHQYVHSVDFFPSQGDLIAIWDNLADFIYSCLKD